MIEFENPPPPNGLEYDDIDIPIFFALRRPQSVIVPNGLRVDYSLIHPSLLGIKKEENLDKNNENKIDETGQGDVDKDANKNVNEILERAEQLNLTENWKILITASDQNTTDKKISKKKKKARKENDSLANILQKEEHTSKRKKKKHHKRKQSNKDKSSIDSDENNFNSDIKGSVNELVSKSSSKESKSTVDDSNCGKSKSHKHVKKSTHCRNVSISDDDQSCYSDKSKKSYHDSGKPKDYKKVSSNKEQSLPHRSETSLLISFGEQDLRSPEFKVKREVFSDDETNLRNNERKQSSKDKSLIGSDENNLNTDNGVSVIELVSKSSSKESKTTEKDSHYSKSKSHKHSKNYKHYRSVSVSDDDQSCYSDKSRKSDHYSRKSNEYKRVSSNKEQSLPHRSETPLLISYDEQDLRSIDLKVKREVFSDDESSLRKHLNFTKEIFSECDDTIDCSSFNKSSRKKYFVDYDRSLEDCRTPPKSETKQERKIETSDCKDNKEFHVPDVYYCSVCKLTLNSELTWQSHLLGKRHARAIRAQSIHEVALTSLLSSTNPSVSEDNSRHDKPPPGMERIEMKAEVSSIQEVCDGLRDRQIIGLKHVWEIRGEVETSYYCNLCDAPCAASSIMLHLTGYKHRLRCLKEYFPQHYERYKDFHKKKLESIIEDKFADFKRVYRKENIRVFKDVPIERHCAHPYDQPGPSWQVSSSQMRPELMTVTDENGKSVVPSNQEYLDTKFADFHCTVCDSHMNNISMWESHIRGKRHLKNVKKAPQGLTATNKYVEAPPGTVSKLEEQIEQVCSFEDIIVGLEYIRENQGKHGNQYNCFPCGGCCSDIDIIDHILSLKHKIKYLEKMHVDGYKNGIMELNNIQVSNYYREQIVNEECEKMVNKYGRGIPQVYYLKRDLMDVGAM